jgi:nitrite reductase/ring-hydroxylating ferredoxin subunit
MGLSRRTFIKLTGTTVVCTCVGVLGTGGCAGNPASSTPPAPAGSYRIQDGCVYLALSQMGTLLGVGGAVKLTMEGAKDGEQKLVVVRPGEDDYRAFADACTHNGKELDYARGEGLLACCGRSSRFDLSGAVIHGPAEAPLLRYRVWHEGAELVIEI